MDFHNIDLPPLTKQELEFWYEGMMLDEDDPDAEYKPSYMAFTMTCAKLPKLFTKTDYDKFVELAEKKTTPGMPFSDEDRAQLEMLEQMAIHRSDKKKTKFQQKQKQRRKQSDTSSQPVRVKSTGKIGTSLGSMHHTGDHGHMVLFDDGVTQEFDWADIEIVCTFCESNPSTLKKCSRCQQVWYCGRDCQTSDWKDHKKVCKVEDPTEEDDNDKETAACIVCEGTSNLMRCTRCKKARYCGRDCQKSHWNVHKKDCKK